MGKGSGGCTKRPSMSFAVSEQNNLTGIIPEQFADETKKIIANLKSEMKSYQLKPEILWLSGSIAYGTYHDKSDVDIRGLYCERLENLQSIFIPTRKNSMRTWQPTLDETFETEDDVIIFENKKLLKLCTAGSNVSVEFLFSPQLESSAAGELLIKNRHLLINQRVKLSFLGLAAKAYRILEKRDQELLQEGDIKTIRHSYRVQNNLEQLLKTGEMDVTLVQSVEDKIRSWPAYKIEKELRDREEYLDNMHTILPEKSDLDKVNKLSQQIYLLSWER